jgi:hypothetical protein
MVFNQLFITKPSVEDINKIIKLLGLNDINDSNEFTILDMEKNKTLQKFINNEKIFKMYYMPCKRKIFYEKLTNKKCITICRQFLKTIDKDIITREKYIKGTKYLIYKIISKDDKEKINREKKENSINSPKEIVLTFD